MNKETLSDRQLIQHILEGNTRLFGEIIENTQGLVISITHKMITQPEDRKDIVQDIYLKAYHNLGGFKYQSKLSTWIGTIAFNTCISHLKKKKLNIIDIQEGDNKHNWKTTERLTTTNFTNQTEIDLLNEERLEILTQEIDRLPPLLKTLITLFHKQELSYKEIQKMTGLNQGTLKSYLYRARKQLKDNLLAKYKKEDL